MLIVLFSLGLRTFSVSTLHLILMKPYRVGKRRVFGQVGQEQCHVTVLKNKFRFSDITLCIIHCMVAKLDQMVTCTEMKVCFNISKSMAKFNVTEHCMLYKC